MSDEGKNANHDTNEQPAGRAPMTQDEFVAVDGDHCPFCRGCDSIHMDGQNFERCYICGAAYRIEHMPIQITGYKILQKPAYDYK